MKGGWSKLPTFSSLLKSTSPVRMKWLQIIYLQPACTHIHLGPTSLKLTSFKCPWPSTIRPKMWTRNAARLQGLVHSLNTGHYFDKIAGLDVLESCHPSDERWQEVVHSSAPLGKQLLQWVQLFTAVVLPRFVWGLCSRKWQHQLHFLMVEESPDICNSGN